MERKQREIGKLIIKAAAVALFPFLLCLFYCMIRGWSVFSLYIPNSDNNDCLFYYKQVESILSCGFPKGFFGFNESRAMYGSMAAWSPVIYMPWVIWGRIFGWNYYSPLVCNLTFFSTSLAGTVLLVRPRWREILFFLATLTFFPSIPIHLMNVLPEAIVGSVVLLFFGMAMRFIKKKGTVTLIFMSVCICFLTLIRPYMVLLVILPLICLIREKEKWWKYVMLLSSGALSLTAYVLLMHYFTAEYLSPLYDLNAVKMFFEGNVTGAVSYLKKTVGWVLPDIITYLKGAFAYGLTAGTQYIVVMISTLGLLFSSLDKKNKGNRLINYSYTGIVLALFLAILFLLQKANEGGRHFWVFALAGCMILCFQEWDIPNIISRFALLAVLVLFLIRGSLVPTDYDIPKPDVELKANIENWEKLFDREIVLSNTTGYENTIIWVLTDNKNGEDTVTAFNELFALPEGMGISCCTSEYVRNNFHSLKSRYLATPVQGEIHKRCEEEGWKTIGANDDLAIIEVGS